MFGVDQARLVKSLGIMRLALCSYHDPTGTRCDCKFIWDPYNKFSMGQSEVGAGCPELQQAAAMLGALTPQEFEALSNRADRIRREPGIAGA
jgi:hypothetical protein